MGRYRTIRIIASIAAVAALVTLFVEIRFAPAYSPPRTFLRPDPHQTARFEQCVTELTDTATREALDAADNPDVQTLMIRMRQKEAIGDCRKRFPERSVTVEEPLRINLIDLQWRY